MLEQGFLILIDVENAKRIGLYYDFMAWIRLFLSKSVAITLTNLWLAVAWPTATHFYMA